MRHDNDHWLAIVWTMIALGSLFSCDTPISKHVAANKEETEIISVLMQYQDARNHADIKKLMALLHDEGIFTFQCGRMVPKATLKKELPGFWKEIHAGNAAVFPLVHECINGDYYTSGELNDPRIALDQDTARATVLFTKGVCRVELYVSLIRDNDRWLITRTEWGDS